MAYSDLSYAFAVYIDMLTYNMKVDILSPVFSIKPGTWAKDTALYR